MFREPVEPHFRQRNHDLSRTVATRPAHRVHDLDHYQRRGVQGIPPLVCATQPRRNPRPALAQAVLCVDLRVLLQPLGDRRLVGLDTDTLLYDDWRGFVVAEFALVWIANLYIKLYALLRQTLRQRKAEAAYAEHATDSTTVRG